MSREELIFTLIIFIVTLFYLYKKLFSKSSCGGSCGCSSKNETLKNNRKHHKS